MCGLCRVHSEAMTAVKTVAITVFYDGGNL